MLFNSMTFVWFLLVMLVLYYVFPRHYTKHILLAGSYFFYGWWDWRFLGLILGITAVNFFIAGRLNGCEKKNTRKALLVFSIIINLSVLGFFKYFNFFAESFSEILSFLGIGTDYSYLNIILPVGISFYTFQAMAYTLDVWKKRILPEKSFIDFAVFISFFPQLVAGPIERASHLLPQIKEKHIPSYQIISESLWLMLWGYFLKVFVADNLSIVVDQIYENYETISGLDVLICHYAFAFQIFGDFAGYSYIAIGVAGLFGVKLNENFRFPYFVKTPSAFWENWHISLSTWLRDYLYVPLGGNRLSRVLTLRNLIITMVLGGLWHGAAWHFVLWGIFHGVILVLFRVFTQGNSIKSDPSFLTNFIQIFIMFNITCFGWMIFRVPNMEVFFTMTQKLFTDITGFDQRTIYWAGNTFFFIAIPLCVQLMQFIREKPHSLPFENVIMKPVISVAIIYILLAFGNWGTKSFIYFRF